MGTYWHKQGWLEGELDKVTGQPVPGAMPPGLYCEDEAAFRAVEKAAGVQRVENAFTQRNGDDPTWRPLAEAELLRAIAPSATDPDEVERLAEVKAREDEATLTSFKRLLADKLFATDWDDPEAMRAGEELDPGRLPARTGATQTLTSGTVRLRWTQRTRAGSGLGPQNLAPFTGPNRQARRAAAAKKERA